MGIAWSDFDYQRREQYLEIFSDEPLIWLPPKTKHGQYGKCPLCGKWCNPTSHVKNLDALSRDGRDYPYRYPDDATGFQIFMERFDEIEE